jgi:hypothetical protein
MGKLLEDIIKSTHKDFTCNISITKGVEATNINFIVFGLTRSGLEPKIYQLQGEHTNHYTIDEIQIL